MPALQFMPAPKFMPAKAMAAFTDHPYHPYAATSLPVGRLSSSKLPCIAVRQAERSAVSVSQAVCLMTKWL
jgi:hypothetical protein